MLRRFAPPPWWFDGAPILVEVDDPDDGPFLTVGGVMWMANAGMVRQFFAPIEDEL